MVAQQLDVVTDHRQLDDDLCPTTCHPGDSSIPGSSTRRTVSGSARATSPATSGPPPRAAWVRDTLAPHHTADGRLDGWDGVVENITEARALSHNLRRTSAMLHALVSNLPTGVFFVQGPHGQPALVNARARQLLASGGRPNGFTTEIYYTLVTPVQGPDSAAAIASDLAQIGVRAELRLLQSADWLQQYFGPPDSRKGLWAGTTNWEQTFEAESVWRWWSDEVAVDRKAGEAGARRDPDEARGRVVETQEVAVRVVDVRGGKARSRVAEDG